jgi:hypothetical protein
MGIDGTEQAYFPSEKQAALTQLFFFDNSQNLMMPSVITR